MDKYDEKLLRLIRKGADHLTENQTIGICLVAFMIVLIKHMFL
jgi:hypothetical protein